MEESITAYTLIEVREPAPQQHARSSVARMIHALFIEHRLPYTIQKTIERVLRTVGLKTKIVEKEGLRFRVRRLSWDEGFLHNAVERKDYTRGGYSLRETDTVIDIGANIGAFSVYAARHVSQGRVIAFEPASDNYALLADNASLNGLSNLTAVRAAVAGHSGEITLFRGAATGLHSTTLDRSAQGVESEVVEAISLEDVFQRYHVGKCHLLKLNCEGAEYEILYSAPGDILNRIERIVMEYHAKENKRQKANALVDYLCKSNFEVVEYTDYIDHDCGFLCMNRVSKAKT